MIRNMLIQKYASESEPNWANIRQIAEIWGQLKKWYWVAYGGIRSRAITTIDISRLSRSRGGRAKAMIQEGPDYPANTWLHHLRSRFKKPLGNILCTYLCRQIIASHVFQISPNNLSLANRARSTAAHERCSPCTSERFERCNCLPGKRWVHDNIRRNRSRRNTSWPLWVNVDQ